MGLHVAPEPARAEFRGDDDCAAAMKRCQGRGDQSVDVEQRHDAIADVLRPEFVALGDGGRRMQEVRLAKRYTLWLAGGAARVKKQGDGVLLGKRLKGRSVAFRAKSQAVCGISRETPFLD